MQSTSETTRRDVKQYNYILPSLADCASNGLTKTMVPVDAFPRENPSKMSSHAVSLKQTPCTNMSYYMTWVCSRSNACSDWLILGHYSPVMPTGRLRACKSQAKNHIINNLLTSNVRSLRENLKPRPCRIDLAIARSIRQGLGPRFSRKDLTLG